MVRGPKRRSSRIFEATVEARRGSFKWLLACAVALFLLGASGCLVSFNHYAEGDVCDAGRDAGVRLSDAPDPVLRGCDAGPEPEPVTEPESDANAGAAGAEATP